MKWTPWFTAHQYAYRQAGNGAFVELAPIALLDLPTDEPGGTVFLQGDDATQFIDTIERLEANEDVIFRIGILTAIDQAISEYFTE
jgi:hypothetical protein